MPLANGGYCYLVKKPVRATSRAIGPKSDLLQRGYVVYFQAESIVLAPFESK